MRKSLACMAVGMALTVASLANAPAQAGDGYAPEANTLSTVVFSGVDVAPKAFYLYQGAIHALNRDLGKDGFLIRTYGGYVSFKSGAAYPGTQNSGEGFQGDVMIGYKRSLGHANFTAYVGGDYQYYGLNPDDPTSKVRGGQAGVKVAADLETNRDRPLYAALNGSYSTAFKSYWARGRLGLNHEHITFGPEVIALGNESFDARRVGGFLTLNGKIGASPVGVTLSAGHQFIDSSSTSTATATGTGGASGTYGAISFFVVF